ncbi:MAG: HD-GYP domain-containing protein [Chloroflexota bacterium]
MQNLTSSILIVDDSQLGRDVLSDALEPEGYQLSFAKNGHEALEMAASLKPDVILLDVMMPVMNGYEVCRRLRADPNLADVPVIMVTALDDRAARLDGIQSGADDFISKPFDRWELRARLRTITRLNRYRKLREEHLRLEQMYEELRQTHEATLEGWVDALDLRDRETEGHSRRVVELTLHLARAAGVPDEDMLHIRRGALLHDIGKLGIPDAVLLKPTRLSDEDWVIIRMHPVYARQWLDRIPYLRKTVDIPYCHHERWDGTGYPQGVKGEQIPFAARLFALVDVWDALRSARSYRPAWSEDEAIAYSRANRGSHFDPQVVQLFLECWESGSLNQVWPGNYQAPTASS